MGKYKYFESAFATARENNLELITSAEGNTILFDFALLRKFPADFDYIKEVAKEKASEIFSTIYDQYISALDLHLHYAVIRICKEYGFKPVYYVFVLSRISYGDITKIYLVKMIL